jgi:hypothetical protein
VQWYFREIDSENIYVESVERRDFEPWMWKIHVVFVTHEFCYFFREGGLKCNLTFMIFWVVFYSKQYVFDQYKILRDPHGVMGKKKSMPSKVERAIPNTPISGCVPRWWARASLSKPMYLGKSWVRAWYPEPIWMFLDLLRVFGIFRGFFRLVKFGFITHNTQCMFPHPTTKNKHSY